jgi:hypothetical protein
MESLPPELLGRAFSVREAVELGVSDDRLRRRSLTRPFYGVRAPLGGPTDLESRCRAYLPRMSPGQFFSHLTAARLWGLWLPTQFDSTEILHVTAPLPGRAPDTIGVRGHHIAPDRAESTLLRGLPVAIPLEAARAMVPTLSVEQLVVLLDGLRRRDAPVVSEAQLLYLLAKHGGQRGVRKLRMAYHLSREGVASAKETELRRGLIRAGLPEPEVNALISGPGAVPRRFGDLVFREWGVVAEYEGSHHQVDRTTYVEDIDRFEQLADDWRFVRVTKEHLRDIPAIAHRIRLARRG